MLSPQTGGDGKVIKLGEVVMILDLHRQGLSVSAIAFQLNIDRKTVRKYLARGLEAPVYGPRQPRPRRIDPFVPYLRERVGAWPGLTGRRLFRELKECGYQGGYTAVTDALRKLRSPATPVFEVRFETSPGDQAQVDSPNSRWRSPTIRGDQILGAPAADAIMLRIGPAQHERLWPPAGRRRARSAARVWAARGRAIYSLGVEAHDPVPERLTVRGRAACSRFIPSNASAKAISRHATRPSASSRPRRRSSASMSCRITQTRAHRHHLATPWITRAISQYIAGVGICSFAIH
jgi:hypothetical protein